MDAGRPDGTRTVAGAWRKAPGIPSSFEDAVLGTLVIRLYILDDGNHVMAIEVDDTANGGHLAGYDLLVKSLLLRPG